MIDHPGFPTSRGRPRALAGTLPGLLLLTLALTTTPVSEAAAPKDAPPFPSPGQTRMHALLEKTLLQVNVLTLDIMVDDETASRITALIAGQTRYSDDLADSISRAVLIAPQAWVRMEFLRDVSRNQYFGGIRDNMEKARRARLIDQEYLDETLAQLPVWYDFLADRGVKKGDVMAYWIRGDSLETTYHGVEGETLLDFVRGNPKSRYGVLGSYLAEGSSFRRNLVKSLVEKE
jgi:plasmid maintenance system antidote protein VapI